MDGGIWGYRSPQNSFSGRQLPGREPSRGDEGGKRADENTFDDEIQRNVTSVALHSNRQGTHLKRTNRPCRHRHVVGWQRRLSCAGAPPARRAEDAGATAVQVAGESTACEAHSRRVDRRCSQSGSGRRRAIPPIVSCRRHTSHRAGSAVRQATQCVRHRLVSWNLILIVLATQ